MKTVVGEDLVLLHHLISLIIDNIMTIKMFSSKFSMIFIATSLSLYHDFDADLSDIFLQVFNDLYRNFFTRLQLGCSESTLAA